MRKYGLSTDVFNSYVADFHGTTVELFAKQSPDQPSNKAVCVDCHGVHDIASVKGSSPEAVKANLLVTCQKCHPDATTAFPDSWVGHFAPSRNTSRLSTTSTCFTSSSSRWSWAAWRCSSCSIWPAAF